MVGRTKFIFNDIISKFKKLMLELITVRGFMVDWFCCRIVGVLVDLDRNLNDFKILNNAV